MRPSTAETSPLFGRTSPLKRELPQPLPSIMHAMGGYPLESLSMPKRARVGSDVGLDVQASYSLLGHMPRQAMIYPSIPQQHPYHQQATSYAPATEVQTLSSAGSSSPSAHGLPTISGVSVWDTVLSTGKFPTDVCLSEHGSGAASPTAAFNPNKTRSSSEDATECIGALASTEVKQGRWTADEEQYASSLIRAVNSGEVVLPPNVSVRKFVADNLQCKTMRVSKKFRSLGSSPRDAPEHEEEPVTPRDESFNPLSLKSIMNNESSASTLSSDVLNVAETIANANLIRQSPSNKSGKKSTQRVLKRSDYSQHGRVRSGRWSVEEENYAKAMIEAFKSGYLPLHGNVSCASSCPRCSCATRCASARSSWVTCGSITGTASPRASAIPKPSVRRCTNLATSSGSSGRRCSRTASGPPASAGTTNLTKVSPAAGEAAR